MQNASMCYAFAVGWIPAPGEPGARNRLNPNSAEAHYSYAAFLAGLGKDDEYISQLQRLLQLRPDYPYGELRLADAFFAKGEFDKAKMHYLAAIRINPNETAAYNNLGKLYLTQGQVSQAVVQFNEALRLNPQYKEAEENLRVAKAADAEIFPAAHR